MTSECDMIKCTVSISDCRENNEAREVQFLRSDSPKITHGLSPLSSASLYLRTHTSIPCAISLKSLLSTLSLRYLYISGGKVTVNEILLRAMQRIKLHTVLNMCNSNMYIAHSKCAGLSKYDRNQPISASYEGNERLFKIVQHRRSGQEHRQYHLQDLLGVLGHYGTGCKGRHRSQDVGSHTRDIRHTLRRDVA